jgi:replicative DNA helicase
VLEGDPTITGGPVIPYFHPDLTRLLAGMAAAEIIAISAVTGGAKSVAMTQSFRTAGAYGPALLASNEMTTITYAQRIMAAEAGVNIVRVRDPHQRTDDDSRALGHAVASLSRAGDLFLLDGVFSVTQLRTAIDDVMVEAGQLVWCGIDWIQLMQTMRRGATRHMELEEIMRDLVKLAHDARVPIMVAAQVDKQSALSGTMRVEAIRDSSSIGNMAATAIHIVLEPTGNGTCPPLSPARFEITKSRHGPKGHVKALFDGPHLRFVPVDERHTAPR